MKARSEASVKKAIVDYLRLRSVVFFRQNSGLSMMPGGKKGIMPVRFGTPGMGDILVLLPPAGQALWLEVKRPLGARGGTGGSVQSVDQQLFERQVREAGARYAVVRSVEDVERELAAPSRPAGVE